MNMMAAPAGATFVPANPVTKNAANPQEGGRKIMNVDFSLVVKCPVDFPDGINRCRVDGGLWGNT